MSSPGIWITRPGPGNETTSAYLRSAGFDVVPVPVLEVRLVDPEGGLPPAWPDWVLFVSGNAVRGLERAVRAAGLTPSGRTRVRAAAVGARTALEAAGQGWNVELVPSNEDAQGLLELLRRFDLEGQEMWLPAGNREGSARGLLSQVLRERGADVRTFSVYETLDRDLTAEDEAALNAHEPGAIVFHSPSAVDAVFSKTALAAARRWHDTELVAIGSTTAARCRTLRTDRISEALEPSDPALVKLLSSLGKWPPADARARGRVERKSV